MQETNKKIDINRLERRHYIIGGLVIGLAFILQPFSLFATQLYIAPALAPYFIGEDTGNQVTDTSTEGKEISSANLKLTGNKDAQIYLVEFSDYECPFCQRFHETPKNIVKDSNGKVAWAWKHYPLPFHPNAEPAAIAAECVNKLSGSENFWKYSDVLIANQQNLNDKFYKAEAAKLGINAPQFASCLNDPQMKKNVTDELAEGTTLGVNGTPNTFVVKNENGQMIILESISGALPEATVKSIVEKYIQ